MSVEERIVLIIGKTESGKSSICNQIIKNKFSLDNTKSIQRGYGTIEVSDANHIHVTFIDTVGFGPDKSTWPILLSQINNEIMRYAADGLNLVIFTVRSDRIIDVEKDALDFLTENNSSALQGISALVITHCDNKSKEARGRYINEFASKSKLQSISSRMGKGIFAVSFPDISKMAFANQTAIDKDGKVIQQLIKDCSPKVKIKFPEPNNEHQVKFRSDSSELDCYYPVDPDCPPRSRLHSCSKSCLQLCSIFEGACKGLCNVLCCCCVCFKRCCSKLITIAFVILSWIFCFCCEIIECYYKEKI